MKHKVRKVLIIMVLTLPIIFSFGSYGLYSWSLSLDGDMGFLLFYSPLASLHRINGELGLNRFVEEGRQKFSLLRKETFPSAPVQKKLAGSSDARDFSMESAAPLPATLPEEEPVPAEPLFKGETLDILVIGDSLANSVGKKLEPMVNDYDDMTCHVEGVISSNLIRLDYYDWLSEAPRLAKENSPDCVLIFLGANTMQSFYLDGAHAPLFSDKWLEIYRERAGMLLSELNELDTDVYWMVLPPMQKESYNKNILYLNGVIDQVCLKNGVDRFSYSPLLTDEQGTYISEIVVDDRQILLRSDGIHFTLDGASYVSDFLISRLREMYELPPLPAIQNNEKPLSPGITVEEESLRTQETPL